jgi:starvation-inducible DNA-binding protein
MNELQKALQIAFASEFSFFLKAQNYHWNVTGPLFPQLHDLFGKIYEEVYDSIDPFAEEIRASGAFAPASLERFNMLSKVNDDNEVSSADSMLRELLDDSNKMVKILKLCFDIAVANGEEGLADFLAGRMDAHKKHSWMLRATIGADTTIDINR